MKCKSLRIMIAVDKNEYFPVRNMKFEVFMNI